MDHFSSTGTPCHENNQAMDLQGKLAMLKSFRARSNENRRVLDESIRKLDENIDLLEKAIQITLPPA